MMVHFFCVDTLSLSLSLDKNPADGPSSTMARAFHKMEEPMRALDTVRSTLYMGMELLVPEDYPILEREMAELTASIMRDSA